ncbi:hypothetical protein BS78_03G305100 [Paspalum vaginatum]|nr:hypothetical protein BS78_03G305100 [Paspalum vaginatum]
MSSPAENPSSWQEVPMEILGLALHIINSLPDTARVAAVCRAWRRAVVHLHPPLPPQLPWLLLPDFKLCSLSPDGATAAGHRLPLPDGAVPICVGSISDGRVIMLKEQSCFLLNPLSGATSPLPDVDLDGPGKRIPSSVPIPMDCKPSLPRKVVMSCPPGSGSPCILAGISGLGLSCGFEPMLKNLTRPYHHTHHATLFLCRPGAAAWSVTTGPRLWSRSDIVFHKGKLYLFTTDPNPHLYAYDIGEDGDGTLKVTRLTPIFGPRLLGPGAVAPVDSAFFYLVESRGKLVLVQRDFRERRTHAVAVFALDESGIQPRWARMQSLDGEIIFLSANISVSVASSRYRGAGGDRIYFSQEMYMSVDGCSRGMDCPHQHCEVFDMRTRTAEALCMGTAPGHEGWCSGPTWFVPSQQKHDNNAS